MMRTLLLVIIYGLIAHAAKPIVGPSCRAATTGELSQNEKWIEILNKRIRAAGVAEAELKYELSHTDEPELLKGKLITTQQWLDIIQSIHEDQINISVLDGDAASIRQVNKTIEQMDELIFSYVIGMVKASGRRVLVLTAIRNGEKSAELLVVPPQVKNVEMYMQAGLVSIYSAGAMPEFNSVDRKLYIRHVGYRAIVTSIPIADINYESSPLHRRMQMEMAPVIEQSVEQSIRKQERRNQENKSPTLH